MFQNTNNPIAWAKRFLSNSIIQKSQMYNLVRESIYRFVRKRTVKGVQSLAEEEFYNTLLETFAKDLAERKIPLIMVGVNGQLGAYRNIGNKVFELEESGYLDYVEVRPWFKNVKDFGSPEGHDWGKKAHEIVGRKLADYITKNY